MPSLGTHSLRKRFTWPSKGHTLEITMTLAERRGCKCIPQSWGYVTRPVEFHVLRLQITAVFYLFSHEHCLWSICYRISPGSSKGLCGCLFFWDGLMRKTTPKECRCKQGKEKNIWSSYYWAWYFKNIISFNCQNHLAMGLWSPIYKWDLWCSERLSTCLRNPAPDNPVWINSEWMSAMQPIRGIQRGSSSYLCFMGINILCSRGEDLAN